MRKNSSNQASVEQIPELLLSASLGLSEYQVTLEELVSEQQYALTFFGKIKNYLGMYFEDRRPYIIYLELKQERLQHEIHAIVIKLLLAAPNASDQDFQKIKAFLNSLNDPVLKERLLHIAQFRLKKQ